jgi:hypothetical protein
MPDQDIVQLPIQRLQLFDHRLLKRLQADLFNVPADFQLGKRVMEGFAHEGGTEGIMMAGAIGDT